ncbi:MAG: glycosyltransferase, partial [Thermoplasmatota archaeon]
MSSEGRFERVVTLVLACAFGVLVALEAVTELERAARGPRLALDLLLIAVEVTLALFALALLLAASTPVRSLTCASPPKGDVDVLVPTKDEDSAVLARTLAALRQVHSTRKLEVYVIDDSGSAERREATADVAREHGARYVSRAAARGFKAGALNDALAGCSAPFVLVLDVDHEPTREIVENAFGSMDEDVAVVQTRLAWRNADSRLRRLAALLQDQFYAVVQRDRGSRGRAVFTGSAALFRRAALDEVGGFPEETLVEDFDLTLLLHARGWRIAYDDRVGARGLLPWTGRDL